MSSSTLFDYAAVYSLLARFIGLKWLAERWEPRPSMDVETVISQAYHRIDDQDAKLKLQEVELRLREVEIELLKSELEWSVGVLTKTNIVLGTYDYIRLQQVVIKVRAMRSM